MNADIGYQVLFPTHVCNGSRKCRVGDGQVFLSQYSFHRSGMYESRLGTNWLSKNVFYLLHPQECRAAVQFKSALRRSCKEPIIVFLHSRILASESSDGGAL